MKTRLLTLVGALVLPAILSAGVIPIGSNATATFTFAVGSITLPSPLNSGPGSNISGAPIAWTFTTTGGPLLYTGGGPSFPINQNGAAITFAFTDSPLFDAINANVTLSSATNLSGTVGAYTGDYTDITGTLTYTAGTTVSGAIATYLSTNLGIVPAVGLTSQLDLLVSCGITNVCAAPNIIITNGVNGPTGQSTVTTGNLLAATLTNSSVPEPGTLVLLSGGLLALAGFKRFARKA